MLLKNLYLGKLVRAFLEGVLASSPSRILGLAGGVLAFAGSVRNVSLNGILATPLMDGGSNPSSLDNLRSSPRS